MPARIPPSTGRPGRLPLPVPLSPQSKPRGDTPILLVCAGPLTNVADALLLRPDVASLFTLVWVGGSASGGDAEEYNYLTDAVAARFVLENQQLAVWQFPSETYRKMVISVAELDHSLRNGGAGGAWLRERFNTLEVPDFIKFGPLWCLGDSAPLIVTALDDITSTYEETSALPYRRIYTAVDTRLIISDFFARLSMHK
jgi:purine nucleosidase